MGEYIFVYVKSLGILKVWAFQFSSGWQVALLLRDIHSTIAFHVVKKLAYNGVCWGKMIGILGFCSILCDFQNM